MNEYVHKVSDEESARIQRFLYGVAIGTILFVIVIAVAVITAPHWIKVVSHESERRFMSPHVDWVNEHLLDASEPELQQYVEELGNELAAGMDVPANLELSFIVVEGSAVNAFTTLGGYIFVVEGLIRELDNENSLAMVLAHEIAHARNRDPLSSAGRGLLLQILISSLSGSGGMDAGSTAQAGFDVMLNVYSRGQEEAADRLAVTAVHRRYGHVGGATQLFETLREEHGDDEPPEMLSSHPGTGDRIATITALAEEKGWGREATNPYPKEVQAALSSTP